MLRRVCTEGVLDREVAGSEVRLERFGGGLLLAEVGAVGEGLRPQGPSVAVVVVEVLDDGGGVVGQVHDLVVEHLGLGDLEDDHGGGEDDAEEAQGERLPRLERDERQGERHERAHLELETQQEGDDDLAQHAASSSSCHNHLLEQDIIGYTPRQPFCIDLLKVHVESRSIII